MFTNAVITTPGASIITSRPGLTCGAKEPRVHFPTSRRSPTRRSKNAFHALAGRAQYTFQEPQDAAGAYQEALPAVGIRTMAFPDTISDRKYTRPAVLAAAQ